MIRRSSLPRCSSKFRKIHQKTPLRESLQLYEKEALVQVFSCQFCEIFKNTFFTEHIWPTTFGLVKPCLNSDLYFISKTSATALLETIVSYKPLPSLSQENRKTFPQHFWIHQHNSLNVYLFLNFEPQLRKSKEFNDKRMKVQVREALKNFFCHQKSNKKADKLCMKFSSTSSIVHELEPKKWLFCSGG